MSNEKVNLSEKFALFHDHWSPKVIASLNGQEVKVVKFQGSFDWHHHEAEDELFLVIKGEFTMRFRDREERIRAGELIVVPRGVEHCPVAENEVEVLLFEPCGTLNTGNVVTEKTVEKLQAI